MSSAGRVVRFLCCTLISNLLADTSKLYLSDTSYQDQHVLFQHIHFSLRLRDPSLQWQELSVLVREDDRRFYDGQGLYRGQGGLRQAC